MGRDALASVAGLGGEMADPQAIPDDDAWLDDEDGCVEVNTCSSQAVVRSRFGFPLQRATPGHYTSDDTAPVISHWGTVVWRTL